jgi:glutamate dehydrogenase
VTGQGLTRPELAVLIAYGKMVLKEEFNIEAITTNPYYNQYLLNAFPKVLRNQFAEQMQEHPLRGEIIATKLTNEIINDMGLNFVHRIREETGANVVQICNAYSIVKAIFNMGSLWESVEDLDNVISAGLQLEILDGMRRTLRRIVRWYIRHGEFKLGIDEAIKKYLPAFTVISTNLTSFLVDEEVKEVEDRCAFLVSENVPKEIAYKIASLSNLFSSLDLAQMAELKDRPVEVVARLYYQLGHKFELHWFLTQIIQQGVSNNWQALARASYREELDWQQRAITLVLLQCSPDSADADKILSDWSSTNSVKVARWLHMMTEFKTSDNHEFAKFSVALRELMLLSISANH